MAVENQLFFILLLTTMRMGIILSEHSPPMTLFSLKMMTWISIIIDPFCLWMNLSIAYYCLLLSSPCYDLVIFDDIDSFLHYSSQSYSLSNIIILRMVITLLKECLTHHKCTILVLDSIHLLPDALNKQSMISSFP